MTHKNYTKTPLQRRLFFWSLVVSCITIIFFVVFFSLGYRFSFVHDIFIYAGSINIKSTPRTVDVYIDNKKPSNRHFNLINDSYHITSIRYGLHDVRFSAPGYKQWHKEHVRIRSGIATEFWNIILVKDTYKRASYDVDSPLHLFFAPKYDLLAYVKETENTLLVPIINIETNLSENTIRDQNALFDEEKKENIEWAPNTQHLIIPVLRAHKTSREIDEPQSAKTASLLEDESINATTDETSTDTSLHMLETPRSDYLITARKENHTITSVYLSELLPGYFFTKESTEDDTNDSVVTQPSETLHTQDAYYPTIRNMRFHPKKDSVLYGIIDNTLFAFDLSSSDVFTQEAMITTPLMHNVLAYDFADDGLFVLTEQGVLFYDKNYAFTKPYALTGIEDINPLTTHHLIAYDKNRVLHIDQSTGRLTIFNKDGDHIFTRVLADDVVHARFSDDGKKVIYHNGHDISLYMTREWDTQPFRTENTTYHITTFDTPIVATEWTRDYEHVIVSSDKTITLVDLDHRFGANTTPITTQNINDTNLIANHEKNLIFFIDESDGRKQLYSIDFPEKEQGLF